MPEYPTQVEFGVPCAQHGQKPEQGIDLALPPVQLPGINNRSDASCAPSGKARCGPADFHSVQAAPRSASRPLWSG